MIIENKILDKKKVAPSFIKDFFRRSALLGLNSISNNNLFLGLLGNLKISTVFVAYGDSPKTQDQYTFPFQREKMYWSPSPVGFFKQAGQLGIMFVISSMEKDFNASNFNNLQLLVERSEQIARMLGAECVKFSGVLPSILDKLRVKRNMPATEKGVTAEAVFRSTVEVVSFLNLDAPPIILFGGAGYIGSELAGLLVDKEFYIVDKGGSFPKDLHGKPAVLINLAPKGALARRVQELWPEMVIINESYGFGLKDLVALKSVGCRIFTISGVIPEIVFPPFPWPFKGAIPCCAAHLAPGIEAEMLIRRIVF